MVEGFQFYSPTRILFGHGLVADLGDELARFGRRRAMVVTQKALRNHGIVERVENACRTSTVETVTTFDDVTRDAGLASTRTGLALARKHDVDLLVAVGGGSVMDTAKAIGLALTHGGDPMDFQGAQHLPGPCRPLVAIPTTAGTGSEVSNVAVVHDEESKTKVLFADNHLLPDLAILDPDLTLTLPPRMTAAAGIEALTHAVEAYVSIRAFAMTDALALKAAEMITTHLLQVVCNGQDKHARGQMLMASCMAGVAFTQAGMGCVHALSHTLGGRRRISHGEANAILLPFGMEYNLPECPDRFAELSRALGVRETRGVEPAEAGRKAVERVRQLQTLLKEHAGLPVRLTEVGITPEMLPEIAAAAMVDGAMVYNRRPCDERSLLDLLKRAL